MPAPKYEDAWYIDNATAKLNPEVTATNETGNKTLTGDLTQTGNANITGTVTVNGATTLNGNVSLGQNITLSANQKAAAANGANDAALVANSANGTGLPAGLNQAGWLTFIEGNNTLFVPYWE